MPNVTLLSTCGLTRDEMIQRAILQAPQLKQFLEKADYCDLSGLSTHDGFFELRKTLMSKTSEWIDEHLRSSVIVIVDRVLPYNLYALESDDRAPSGHPTIALLILAFPSITWFWLESVGGAAPNPEYWFAKHHDISAIQMSHTIRNWSAIGVFDGSGLRSYVRALLGPEPTPQRPLLGIVMDDEVDYLYFGAYAFYRGGRLVLPVHTRAQADLTLGQRDVFDIMTNPIPPWILEDLDLAFEDDEREDTNTLKDYAERNKTFPLLRELGDQRLLWTVHSAVAELTKWKNRCFKVPASVAILQERLSIPRIGNLDEHRNLSRHSIQGRLYWVTEALIDQAQRTLESPTNEPRRSLLSAVCAIDAYRLAVGGAPAMVAQALQTLHIAEVTAEVRASNGGQMFDLEGRMDELSSQLWDCLESSMKPKDAALYIINSQLAVTERLLSLFREANEFELEWQALSLQRAITIKQRFLTPSVGLRIFSFLAYPILWFFYHMISSWPRFASGLAALFALCLVSILIMEPSAIASIEARRIAEMWLSGQNINEIMLPLRFPILLTGFVIIGITASFIYTRLSKK